MDHPQPVAEMRLTYPGYNKEKPVKTNSKHERGIVFVNGVVSFHLWNLRAMVWNPTIELVLYAFPKPEHPKLPKEYRRVQFSLRKNESPIKRFTYSPNNLFCFDFELDLISKSRKQGFKSYSYYDFFFAVILKDGSRIITFCLICGDDLCIFSGTHTFDVLSTSPRDREGKRRRVSDESGSDISSGGSDGNGSGSDGSEGRDDCQVQQINYEPVSPPSPFVIQYSDDLNINYIPTTPSIEGDMPLDDFGLEWTDDIDVDDPWAILNTHL